MLALRTSPAGFPMAPSTQEWEALSPDRTKRDLCASVKIRDDVAELSAPEFRDVVTEIERTGYVM